MRYAVALLFVALVSTLGLAPQPAESATQILVSSIGDYDCFGYGAPGRVTDVHSPCGTLATYPVAEPDDTANTDTLLACPGLPAYTWTHTYDLPAGSRILGAVWTINLGGIE